MGKAGGRGERHLRQGGQAEHGVPASGGRDQVVASQQRAQVSTDRATLRASFSRTFLQTLPNLVTPLKGHSSSPRSCPETRSAPSERFWYCNMTVAPKHTRKHETHPPRVKNERKKSYVSIQTIVVLFVLV